MTTCLTIDLGLIGYAEAYALQKRIVAARKAGAIDDVLLLCEHPHVITQGRNGKREHLLAGENVLRQKGVEFHETSRGGDVTYHGPGQIVGYPILNLAAIRRDVVWYVRMLEEVMIRTSADFGVTATREAGKTGVWSVPPQELTQSTKRTQSSQSGDGRSEKIGAIGVHISRWVTSHGFRSDRSLWHRRPQRHINGEIAGPRRGFPGSWRSIDEALRGNFCAEHAASFAARALGNA
jgi:lipoyl(octanoyl) transferase